jgi:GNAT superfamily N-acetyltransferase
MPMTDNVISSAFENFIQNKYGCCFYALEEGSPPLIYNLYVHPQYRNLGHSRKLLRLVINEIRDTGYKGDIYIEAEPRENSISLEALKQYYRNMELTIYDGLEQCL